MSLPSKDHSTIRRIFILFCYATAIPAVLGWVYFVGLTRNTFRLDRFSTEDFRLVLTLALVPLILCLLGWFMGRSGQRPRWAWLPAALLFVLAALGWCFTMGSAWGYWRAAADTERITAEQFRQLCLCAACGFFGAVVPVVVLLLPETKKREN